MKLLPCPLPLCGSPAWLHVDDMIGSSVRCGSCGLRLYAHGGDRESLIRLWNTRLTPSRDVQDTAKEIK